MLTQQLLQCGSEHVNQLHHRCHGSTAAMQTAAEQRVVKTAETITPLPCPRGSTTAESTERLPPVSRMQRGALTLLPLRFVEEQKSEKQDFLMKNVFQGATRPLNS